MPSRHAIGSTGDCMTRRINRGSCIQVTCRLVTRMYDDTQAHPPPLTQAILIMTSNEKLDLYATRINSLNSKFKLNAVWVVKNLLHITDDVISEKLENLITSVLS